jgi:hypothetical protein
MANDWGSMLNGSHPPPRMQTISVQKHGWLQYPVHGQQNSIDPPFRWVTTGPGADLRDLAKSNKVLPRLR